MIIKIALITLTFATLLTIALVAHLSSKNNHTW